MNTFKIKFVLVALIPLLGFLLLPLEVASHFNSSGVADGFMPRRTFIGIFTLISGLLTFGIPEIARIIPGSVDARIGTAIRLYGLSFGIWMLLFFILVVIANNQKNPTISTVFVWTISSLLFFPLIAFLFPPKRPNKSIETTR
ncbi:MAG: DUF1648 domain-containing protein [Luteolibacter sp.]